MTDTETYTNVPILRKLIAKKIDKIQDLLRERSKHLNDELDCLEEEFLKETEKDELELEKLQQYKINTIELFNAGDKQLGKIDERIEVLKQRLESRKVKLEWNDINLTNQLITIGTLVRMEEKGGSRYEWLEAADGEYEDTNTIKYEQIDEDFLEKVHSFKASTEAEARTPEPEDTFHKEEPVVKNPGIQTGEYLKPMRYAPLPPTKRPPPPPVPVPPSRGTRKTNILAAIPIMKSWRSKSFDDNESETETKTEEPDLYCKVPEGKYGLGGLRKKSNSLGGKLNLLGAPNQLDIKLTAKCMIGSGPGQILKPKNIAISDKTGCIFVAEKGNNRVQVFAGTGDPMYSFSRKSGSTGHAMIKPYGICVLNERVYVSVSQFSCLHAYKTNGEFIMEKGHEGKGEGQFVFPTGMNTDGSSKIFVCDYGNNRVQVFSKDLHFKQIIGVGNLSNPTDVAVDREWDLFVVDRSTTIVHQFSNKGLYKRKIIKISMFPILSNPQYITISPKGNLVLSDLLTNSLNIFSMDGQLRWTLGGPRDKEMFGEPRGITFDKNGDLVVACHKEIGCLQILEINI